MASQPGNMMVGSPSPEDVDRDVRTLKEAVRVVFGGYGGAPSEDPKERLRATEWLHSFQRRDSAWDACVAVLGAPRGTADNQVGLDEQVFASQALLYKCRRRRAAITGDDVGCLLKLALGFTGRGLRAVLIQLCLGVCACAVRHTGWEASKVVPDMVLYCQKASEDEGHGDPGPRVLMLQLLTVLPDEATARASISAPPERRREFLWTLRAEGEAGRLALGVLSQLMEPGGLPAEGGALGSILRCALAWMQLEAVERGDMLGSPVMALALEALESPEACEDACELVTLSLEAFTEPAAAQEMLPRVLSRAPSFTAAPSEDVCRCLAMVFAAAACSYIPGILKPELAGHWGSLLQIMLGMLEHPSLEIAGLALEFWGLLGELLSETSASEGGRGPRSPALEESVRHACRISMLRARYPSLSQGGVEGMDEDDRDELEEFREQVYELMQSLVVPAAPSSEQRSAKDGCAATPSPASGGGGGAGLAVRGTKAGGGEEDCSNGRPARPLSAAMGTQEIEAKGAPGVGVGVGVSVGVGVGVAMGDGGEAGRRRSFAGEKQAEGGRNKEGEMAMLSPVQAGLLKWLEELAVSCTGQALESDLRWRQQQQQQQQQHPSGLPNTCSTGANGSAVLGTVNHGDGDQMHGDSTAAFRRAEGGKDGAGGGGGGGRGGTAAVDEAENILLGGDWPGVEVILRMLGAVTEALDFRDTYTAAFSSDGDGPRAGTTSKAAAPPFLGPGAVVSSDNGGRQTEGGGEGSVAMEGLVSMLPLLPPGRRELQRSAAVLVGGLATWLARRPSSLEPALRSVLGMLGLREEGVRRGEASMRDKGEDHVGVVALSKLVSAAGPSLAAVDHLPTHLLERYMEHSAQLQRHRLLRPLSSSASAGAASAAGAVKKGEGIADEPRLESVQWVPQQPQDQQRLGYLGAEAGAPQSPPPPPPPSLHAGSLRLFLGSLCRMLGEAPMLSADGRELGLLDYQRQRQRQEQGRGTWARSGSTSATGEVEEVLRALVEGELRCLGGVLDRRREIAAGASSHGEQEVRAMADVSRDSLSNLSLILHKTAAALDAPGLVAGYCGLSEGPAASCGGSGSGSGSGSGDGDGASNGGDVPGEGGVLIAMVAAFGLGEENILHPLCRLFEALVWSTSQRIRHLKGEEPRSAAAGANSSTLNDGSLTRCGGGGLIVGDVGSNSSTAAAAALSAASGGLRISCLFGDALAEAFQRRPFHRFLDALRCVTKELPSLERPCPLPEMVSDGVAVPDIGLRAGEWVDRCLWAAAVEVGGTGNSIHNISTNGTGRPGGVAATAAAAAAAAMGGPDAHPELVEALFKLMAEWVKELPVPSLRWLEAWLSVAVSGLSVRHRGPAKAVLGLVQACCRQQKEPQFAATFAALLRDTPLGVSLTRGLLSGMCGAMPSWMLEDLVSTVRSLFDSLSPAVASTWVEAVLRDPSFERYGVSNEQKVAFSRKVKEDFCNKDWRGFKAGLKAFCGGKKKGTAGTPPVHASAVAAAAARQQQPLVPPNYTQNPVVWDGQHHHHHSHGHYEQQQQQQQQQQQFNSGAGAGPFGASGGFVVSRLGGGGAAEVAASSPSMLWTAM